MRTQFNTTWRVALGVCAVLVGRSAQAVAQSADTPRVLTPPPAPSPAVQSEGGAVVIEYSRNGQPMLAQAYPQPTPYGGGGYGPPGPGGQWQGGPPPGGQWQGPGGDSGGRSGGRRGGRRGSWGQGGGQGGQGGAQPGPWGGGGGGPPNFGPGGPGGGGPFGGGDFVQRMLERADANHNGLIEENEVEGWRRERFEGMVRQAGMEPKYPLKVDDLKKKLAQQGNRPGGQPGGSASSSKVNEKPSSTPETRKVSAFGRDASTAERAAPRFGSSDSSASSGSGGSDSSGGEKKSEKKKKDSRSKAEKDNAVNDREMRRLRRNAESMMRRFDANKSGRLERSEWASMQDRLGPADADRNGEITLDELIQWLSNVGRPASEKPKEDESSRSAPPGYPSTSYSSAPPTNTAGRFLTATERLPSGLPDWFAQKDANGDGQVSMAEYATYWSNSKADEFTRLDLNGDGIITPNECLAAK